jgi:polyhydroxybutyrate depolymerase
MPHAKTISAVLCLIALALAAHATPAAACDRPIGRGFHDVALTSAGAARPFLLYVPTGYDGRRRLPLVLNLHGVWSDGAGQMRISRLARMADARGFAVVAPDGALQRDLLHTWNVPGLPIAPGEPVPAGTADDERYLLEVIDATAHTVCSDRRRVYLTGYSGGAWLASQMACDHPERITAIAPVVGLRAGWPQRLGPGRWRPDPATCDPRRAVPVLGFHGLHDPWTPYRGNDNEAWGYSVPAALRRWAALDACRTRRSGRRVTRHVEFISYRDCRGGAVVGLYLARDAGHTWPGSAWPRLGRINHEIDANRLMWDFFRRYRLPGRS